MTNESAGTRDQKSSTFSQNSSPIALFSSANLHSEGRCLALRIEGAAAKDTKSLFAQPPEELPMKLHHEVERLQHGFSFGTVENLRTVRWEFSLDAKDAGRIATY